MENREPFWIPDTEVGFDVKSGGSDSSKVHIDRKSHSRSLKSSFRSMLEGSEASHSSLEDSGYDVFLVKVRDDVNPDKQDAELSELGIEVKAVLDDSTLLVALKKNMSAQFDASIEEYGESSGDKDDHAGLDLISGFESNTGPEKYDGQEETDSGPIHVTITLVPKMDAEDYLKALPKLRKSIEDNGGTIIDETVTDGRPPIVDAEVESKEAILSICKDSAIYRINKDRNVSLDDFFLNSDWFNRLELDSRIDIDSLPIVSVIDSGIDDDSLVGRLVVDRYFRDSKPTSAHGTKVAGRVAFGYGPNLGEETIRPLCRLIDCNIFSEGMKESDLRKELKGIVEKYHHICRTYNISINVSPVNHHRVSALAEEMDMLQSRYDVIFVVSSGNYKGFASLTSMDSLLSNESAVIKTPSESVLSMSVGSAAPCDQLNSISKRDMLAPYSTHGPGIGNSVKPEVLAYTANVTFNGGRPSYSSLGESRVFGTDGADIALGTSFASPIVANNLARIISEMEQPDTLMAKTWLIHTAKPTSYTKKVKGKYVGFGIVDDGRLLSTAINEAAFIHKGRIGGKYKRQIIHLRVPDIIIGHRCIITVTCMNQPILDSTRGSDYVRSKLLVTLRSTDNEDNLEKLNEKRSLGNPASHCQKKLYSLELKDKELVIWVTSTIYDDPDRSTVPYVLIVSICDESGRINIFDAVRSLNIYPVLSSIESNKARVNLR